MTLTYSVAFRPRAAKAFERLDAALQRQLVRKLKERCANPKVPADRVRDIPNGFRIKLRASGLRAIYLVRDAELIVLVLAIGKRQREEAYKDAIREFGEL